MKKFTLHEITTLALMLSMIFVLSALEGMFPPLPFHMRFGLSNVVTMYALFFIGGRAAFTLAGLKSLSVLLMRGPVAGLLSLSGGVLSLLMIALLAAVCRNASYFLLSVAGAITHNMGQLAVASWLTSTNLLALFPVMILAGILAGSLTAALLRVVMPFFKRAAAPNRPGPP
ncbi:MAG: Gx transporter family protein [Synergistaceae bacterium]|jgi:heptaprenyl diphosphate synthase|nr:Gx transporter family protein [Synergistaceae bacterium]